MGNCCFPVRYRRRSVTVNPKSVTLLLVGLDKAGKTTIAKRLLEEPLDEVMPTVGFSKVSLQEKGFQVTIYDLGGGPQIRDIWPRYYPDIHGVIFVVDASDTARIHECRKVLEGLLLDSYISGKPVLLLANKQDVEGALDEIDIVDRLNVEPLVNQQKCPTLVELCSARHFTRKMDVGISNGYKWLLRCISKDYPSLNNRVQKDLSTQEELERINRVQREERIRKVRLEREIEEKQSKVEKPHQNGVIHMDVASLPGQIQEASEESPQKERVKRFVKESVDENALYSISYSCEFFKFEKDHSDAMLLRNLEDKNQGKNFLVRPKSSGPRLNTSRSNKSDVVRKRTAKRKLYQRHNKTAPSPQDQSAEVIGPLPKVFDPTYHSEVKPFASEHPRKSSSAGKPISCEREVQVEELELTSKSMPTSRKPSARNQSRRCSSVDPTEDTSRVKKLPPLKHKKELILSPSELNK